MRSPLSPKIPPIRSWADEIRHPKRGKQTYRGAWTVRITGGRHEVPLSRDVRKAYHGAYRWDAPRHNKDKQSSPFDSLGCALAVFPRSKSGGSRQGVCTSPPDGCPDRVLSPSGLGRMTSRERKTAAWLKRICRFTRQDTPIKGSAIGIRRFARRQSRLLCR